jgi:hypothetical protein
VRNIVRFTGFFEVEIPNLSSLLQLLCALLQFKQVVVCCLDSLLVVVVLAFFAADDISESIDVALVALTFLFKLLKLETCAIDVLPQTEAVVRLGLDLTLEAKNLSFSAGDLLTESRDLDLHVVVAARFVIEEEPGIVAFFLESVERDGVGVLASLKLVFLEELLVLQVPVLGLDRVELVPQREVVLVPLLDLEDLCLQLRDQQVLLVAG